MRKYEDVSRMKKKLKRIIPLRNIFVAFKERIR